MSRRRTAARTPGPMTGRSTPCGLRPLTAVALATSLLVSVLGGVAAAAPKGDGEELGVHVEREGTKTASLLFVTEATGGTFTPRPDAPGVYDLTLTGAAPDTLWFTDRPDRQADSATTADALSMIGFGGKDSPPNAVIDVTDADSKNDAIAVKLEDPAYDGTTNTLKFTATALDKPVAKSNLAGFDRRLDEGIPQSFGPVSLFVDDADTPVGADGAPVLKEYTVYAAVIMNFGSPASGTLTATQGECYNGASSGPFTNVGDGKEYVITMLASESFPDCFTSITYTKWDLHVTSPVDQWYRLEWAQKQSGDSYVLRCQDPYPFTQTKPLTCAARGEIRVAVSP